MNKDKPQALLEITQAVMNVLDTWELNAQEIQGVLCLPDTIKARALPKFRSGEASLPNEASTLQRAHYLLRIADALRTSYPRNPKMSARWIKQMHRRFGQRTPLSMMLESGEGGLITVLAELDCTFSWDLTGSKRHG